MRKRTAYLFIFLSLMITTIKPSCASDEYIVASLDRVGTYTEVAQDAINKVSVVSETINSAKNVLGGYIGDAVAAAQEKVELVQEKVENAQEKIEKVQERIEWAKDQKDALMAKYNELNAKISEYKEKAAAAIQQGMEIRDKYKTYVDQATEAINNAKDLKDKVADKVSEVKGLAEEKINDAKGKVGLASGGNDGSEEDDIGGLEPSEEDIKQATQPITESGSRTSSMAVKKQSVKAVSNQADAIISAGVLAQKTETNNVSAANIKALEKEVPILQEADISAAEIVESAKTIKPNAGEIQSDIKLEDQLKASATKAELKNGVNKEKEKIKETDISSSREVFGAKAEMKISKETPSGINAKEALLKIEQKGMIEKTKGAEK